MKGVKQYECESDFTSEKIQPCYRAVCKTARYFIGRGAEFFYNSEVYPLMRDGVSDMHCMSDAYLAEELKMEYEQKNIGK